MVAALVPRAHSGSALAVGDGVAEGLADLPGSGDFDGVGVGLAVAVLP